LYTAMFVPASYNFVPGGESGDMWGVVGVSIAAVALLTEMLVDIDNQLYYEKMSGEERKERKEKKERQNNWNYFAEASFWIGGLVAAKSRYDVWKFLGALPGVCGIVWIVMSEAARRRARWAECDHREKST
jgi:steroid 5-alpha reductase family enzyme